jgi:hypothetical protein
MYSLGVNIESLASYLYYASEQRSKVYYTDPRLALAAMKRRNSATATEICERLGYNHEQWMYLSVSIFHLD